MWVLLSLPPIATSSSFNRAPRVGSYLTPPVMMMRMLPIMRSLWSDLYRETPLQWWWLALGSSWRHSWRGGMVDPSSRSLRKKTGRPETPAASYHPNPRISRYHRWYRFQTPCLHALLHWCVSCQYQPDDCILSSWSCCWHPTAAAAVKS